MIDYLMTWLSCARSHGLPINYLGGWNERGHDISWFEKLHAALAAKNLPIKVVGDDSGWSTADDMVEDPEFAKAVDIVGVHYSCEGGDGGSATSCQSTANALATGKPLWDSEQGSQDDETGAAPLIRAITRGYLDAKMTAMLNWPLIAAITKNLPFSTVGLGVAGQPWSGTYGIGLNTWVTAQVTQFAQPGWQFLDAASGYLGRDRDNGSYGDVHRGRRRQDPGVHGPDPWRRPGRTRHCGHHRRPGPAPGRRRRRRRERLGPRRLGGSHADLFLTARPAARSVAAGQSIRRRPMLRPLRQGVGSRCPAARPRCRDRAAVAQVAHAGPAGGTDDEQALAGLAVQLFQSPVRCHAGGRQRGTPTRVDALGNRLRPAAPGPVP
jgi:hypothetical protein